MYLIHIDRDKLVGAAGGDPWEVNASVQHGSPEQIKRLFHVFLSAGRFATVSEGAVFEARKRIEEAWPTDTSVRPTSSWAQIEGITKSLEVQVLQLPAIASQLEAVAAALTTAQHNSDRWTSTLEEQLTRSDDELGVLIDQVSGRHVTHFQRSLISAEIHNLDVQAIETAKTALQRLLVIRDGYITQLRAAEQVVRRQGYFPALNTTHAPLSPEADDLALAIPVPGTSPEVVDKWWNSLDDNRKAGLIRQHPRDLGNLNGLPTDVRDKINQLVMEDDLNRLRDQATGHCVSVDAVLADPGLYGLSALEVSRYTTAERTRQGLIASGQAEDEHGRHPKLYLLKYQPDAFGGDGAAAIAMGNPDTAANTAIVVKGLGSGVRQGTLANPDGRRLFHEANCADWGEDTAVVMWVGYDAPNSAMDLSLYEPNLARAGGRALAADVNALAVTHHGGPTHLTVVGHSYGSTTVADAAAASEMHAHDVVLLGCPGTDLAPSAADFHLPNGGHLYVGDSSQDEVSWFGHDTIKTPFGGVGLGSDPAMDGYGSTRFKAEVIGYSANPFYDHSHYFDDGSESLFSLGDIVSGHGDALQGDHMTARHRGEYRTPAIVEPEAVRQATTGHRHAAPPR